MMSVVASNSDEFSPALAIILTTIFCVFAFSVWFVYKLGVEVMDGPRAGIPINYTAPLQALGPVYNPYVLEMKDKAATCWAEGVTFSLTAQLPCQLQAYWGVTIKDVFPAVYQTWLQFSHQFQDGTLLKDSCLAIDEKIHYDACEGQIIQLKQPGDSHITYSLGPRPRARYPLVVVLSQLSGTTEQEVEENQIVCAVLLVHLRDDVCPGESHIIGHYVRTATCQPYNLQQLYMSYGDNIDKESGNQPGPSSNSCTGDIDTDTNTAATPQTSQCDTNPTTEQSYSGATCVICQVAPVTRAILPCRHTCVCRQCFCRLDYCPICRGYIHSYFIMDNEDDDEDEDSYHEDERIPLQGENWFERVNERINQFFGFR